MREWLITSSQVATGYGVWQCVLLVLPGQVGNAACSPNKSTFDAGRALGLRCLLVLLDARRRRLGGGAELLTLDWAQAGNVNAVQLDTGPRSASNDCPVLVTGSAEPPLAETRSCGTAQHGRLHSPPDFQ